MPGTFRYSDSDEASKPPPPPVAPRVTVQSWQSVPVAPPQETIDSYPHHVRSGSVDSLESNSSSSVSSLGCGAHTRQLSGDGEFIPTRTVTKTPAIPSHNPLQFVKVQSPLYRKAEQQIKLAKEVKITRDKLKEVEEEWQSNLDNWKSRRRKVSEKVFQRAEEMRQIEAEEQSRQNQQQRKIKTFSEIVEERSSKKRNYNLELYMGQGDDSGVGGTPEPDDQNGGLDVKNSGAPSDVSEEVTSEGESLDSDARSSDKVVEKTPPKVPKKPHSWLSRNESLCESSVNRTSSTDSFHCAQNERFKLDHSSSAEPSDIEGHAGDIETVSSEDDTGYCGPIGNCDSGLESLCGSHLAGDIADSASDFSQDSCSGTDKIITEVDQAVASSDELEDCKYRKHAEKNVENSRLQFNGGNKLNFRIFLKQGIDSKGFGFTLKGGADCDTSVFVDSVVLGGAADLAGLKSYDEILSINGEGVSRRTHSALVFAVKQAMYTGQLDMVIWRPFKSENQAISQEHDPGLVQVKKGSSFAEKIALFSGNSSAEVNCSKSSPVISSAPVQMRKISHQSQELKKESLVLRRRSAFEKNSIEEDKDQNKSRWSACLSQEISPVNRVSNVDRRHSLDCTESSDKISPEKNAKKPPPPPVPSKPKIKLKDNNFELHHVNDECRELLKPETNTKIVKTQNVSSLEAIGKECDTESNKNIVSHPSHVMDESKNCKIDSNNFSSSAIYLLNEQITNTDLVNPVNPSTQVLSAQDRETLIEGREYIHRSEITAHFEENIPKISTSDSHSTVSKHNVQIEENSETNQETLHKHSETFVNNDKISSYSDESIKKDIEESLDHSTAMTLSLSPICLASQSTDDYLALEATVNSNSKDSDQVWPQDEPNGENNIFFDANTDDMQSNALELSPDNGAFNEFLGPADFQENVSYAVEKVQRESNLHYSLQTESEVSIAGIETQQNGVQANSTRFTGNTLIENEFNNEAREYFVEMNLSPGHLTLERIDEDDVVSASTTTSSETPDTETVIEHFPSNISPLPTDDPITEIQTVEYIDDKYMTNPETPIVSPVYNVGETENIIEAANSLATVEPCDPLQILELHKQSDISYANTMSNEDQGGFDHSQEDSLDEDAMYEIEQRLMQQLEQQGEVMLEDMSELHGQLEDEVNRQLLYLSEDSELLDDLDTPRNAEPPSEPPPPPPPLEMEATENKTSPLMRINSTKRIKKELWRRRSDFLGLESTEGIDVDNILPPPPGLEELLKSEREIERGQRQWLEQRLSLQEPLSPVALEAVNNAAITGLSDDICSPEHILEILDAEVYDAVTTDDLENDEWKLKEEYPLPVCEKFVQESQLNSEVLEDLQPFENSNSLRSPQLKARQNIQTLGAAPRAKIMDSDKWITQSENHTPKKQKSLDPVFQDGSTSQSSRHVLEAEKRNSFQSLDSSTHMYQNRRLSMPPTYGTKQPDVTVRTWGDREFEAQNLQRPKSSVWQTPPTTEELYGDYLHSNCPVLQGSSTIDLIESHYELQDFERSKAASHRRRCSCCGDELSEGSAMGIDALQLYFHIECFKCCICQVQLGNGSCGTDVQVKHSQLYCHSCFTPD